MNTKATALLILSLLTTPCFALQIPKAGQEDSRIRSVEYNDNQVVKITGHYGYITHIQLSPTEKVTHIASGDKDAWDTMTTNNHIFIKPIANEAETNMTVLTSHRVYNFELDAHWSQHGAHPMPNDMFFAITFEYPDNKAKLDEAQAQAQKLNQRLASTTTSKNAVNWNYWSKGSDALQPTQAFDDGRFTYITFAKSKDMPAIFMVNSDGSESLVNTNINPQQPNTIIVHAISKQFIARKGSAARCIFNMNEDTTQIENTGTTVKGVARTMKGISL